LEALCFSERKRVQQSEEESVKGSEPTKATTTSEQTLIEKGASGFISFQDLKYEQVVLWPCFFFMRQKATSSTKAGRANKRIAQNLQAGISFWLCQPRARILCLDSSYMLKDVMDEMKLSIHPSHHPSHHPSMDGII
jgi:hypothetical protein